uniref:Uncharacterized protein n=1 Tax=Utricularia reniformis TaxID=192314 RepID=A0A1Y0B2I3_9LAMI|nr:hypothetical protein AEK19_MT1403 [Utricularia reniformis]ART31598.1 hypothetical protein AEK19_MT1403 [Utricularia reniformis]
MENLGTSIDWVDKTDGISYLGLSAFLREMRLISLRI